MQDYPQVVHYFLHRLLHLLQQADAIATLKQFAQQKHCGAAIGSITSIISKGFSLLIGGRNITVLCFAA